jgi:hypothetical protein
MDAIVFSGPTLSPSRAAAVLPGACCLGPVERGDVFRVLRHAPKVICIIDGLFGATLPVWHKEILWALQRGVSVFGAASMGALRAVELAPFGMIGVGRIFHAFANEELENEDEVTVAHAGADREFRATSEALVDIRATLEAAESARVLDTAARERLFGLARDTFYAERSYPALFERARAAQLPAQTLEALGRFLDLDDGRVKLKQLDALDCLAAVRDELLTGQRAADPSFSGRTHFDFSYTDAFDAFASEESSAERSTRLERSGALASELLVEELQLLGPEVFEPLVRQATARALRVVLSGFHGHDGASPSRPGEPVSSDVVEFESLLDELDLSPSEYRHWMDEEARLRQVEDQTQRVLQSQFAPVLRNLGDYPRVAQRARQKRMIAGSSQAPLAAAEVSAVWHAYFEGILNVDVPEDLDAYAQLVGFRDQADLLGAVARELAFRRMG